MNSTKTFNNGNNGEFDNKISVIMSVYNEPLNYIETAIESILNQSYKSLQFVIILDNPCNIETKRFLEEYEQKDSRILLKVNERNLGLTASLNRALSYADGAFVARMDADDISDVNRIEKQLQYLRENRLDFVGCEVRSISETGVIISKRTNKSYPSDCLMKCLMVDNSVAHPTWLVKKSVYTKLNGYRDFFACEDYDFILRALHHGYKIGICDQVLFSYRINTNGISRNNSFRQIISSNYLSKNIDRIDEIQKEELEEENNKKKVKYHQTKYEKALMTLRKSIFQLKDRKWIKGVFGFIIALIQSRYTFLCIKKMVKLKMLRRKYLSS